MDGVCVHPQLCLTLQPFLLDSSMPGSSVHVIFQARILELVAISSSRVSPRPRDWTHVSCISCIAGEFFNAETSEKPRWDLSPSQMSLSEYVDSL